MSVAILGASGLVGRTMVELLADQQWLEEPPLLLTSGRSAGHEVAFRDRHLICRDIATVDLDGVRLALFSAGAEASRRWAPEFVRRGAWVVDNSSAWRRDPDVLLIVPEVNAARLDGVKSTDDGGIVANPNCSTIQIALPCAALDRVAGLREVHVTTLQAVSGAGQSGVDELADQAHACATGDRAGADRAGQVFPRRIAANAVPEIGAMGDDGYFEEERKVHDELRKILDRRDLAVSCTATRVPVWNGHAAAVRVVLARPVSRDEVLAGLSGFPGVACERDPGGYRTPAEVSGSRDVSVGRVRHEPGRNDVILFWVVADNLLKGAAWNAVQIAATLRGVEAR